MTETTSTKKPPIHFKGPTKDEYLIEVRKRVNEYFSNMQKEKTGNWVLYTKSLLLLTSCLFFYFSLLFGWVSWCPRILLWIGLGVSEGFIAVNIGHDALHGSYSKYPLVNRLMGYLAYDCVGFSSWVWKQSHNREHHTYTNIAGVDPDIHKPGVLRLSPHDPINKFHKYQHWYVWFLYSLVSINWAFYADYAFASKYRKEMPRSELLIMLFFKAFNLGYMFFIPLLFSPMAWWQVCIGFVASHLFGGVAIAIVFQLAHVVENVEFPLPDKDGHISQSWSAHEMATTSNFATNSFFVTHIFGGLNFQIEHHLFPKISHVHYMNLSKIVRKTAKEFQLPYYEQPTLTAAVISHARTLKKFSQQEIVSAEKALKVSHQR